MAARKIQTKPKDKPLSPLIAAITHSVTLKNKRKRKRPVNLEIKITKNSIYRQDSIIEGRRYMHSGKTMESSSSNRISGLITSDNQNLIVAC